MVYMCQKGKNYEYWLSVDKVITKISRLTFFKFFGPPCRTDIVQFFNTWMSTFGWIIRLRSSTAA